MRTSEIFLVVTMDDATSEIYIYSAFLVEEEGTDSNVPGAVGGVRAARPAAEPLYRSRQSLLPHGRSWRQGGLRRADPGRACVGASGRRTYRRLFDPGARPLGAIVPAPCLRSGRLLQDRVPKELVLAGITTMAEANAWLRDTYIPAHNARFATQAEQHRTKLHSTRPARTASTARSSGAPMSLYLSQRGGDYPPRRGNPARAERRRDRSARTLHGAGNHRSLERECHRQLARRGRLTNPSPAGESDDQSRSYTTSGDTIGPP